MSVETRICCDRCKRLVLADRGNYPVSSGIMRRLKESLDLCGECDRAFMAWINTPARTATVTPTAPARVGGDA